MHAQEAIASNHIDDTRKQGSDDYPKPSVKLSPIQRFIAHCKRIRRNRFVLEITLIVVVKALILYGLWFAFFSQPLAKHMLVPSVQMDKHIIADKLSHVIPSSNPLSNEVSHDSH